jgi:hypothetical protein
MNVSSCSLLLPTGILVPAGCGEKNTANRGKLLCFRDEKAMDQSEENPGGGTSFPRKRESRRHNYKPVFNHPGCPPEFILSEVEGRV